MESNETGFSRTRESLESAVDVIEIKLTRGPCPSILGFFHCSDARLVVVETPHIRVPRERLADLRTLISWPMWNSREPMERTRKKGGRRGEAASEGGRGVGWGEVGDSMGKGLAKDKGRRPYRLRRQPHPG